MKKIILAISLFTGYCLHSQSPSYQWVKQFDSSKGTAICTDATGNVYSVGNFNSTTDFDPGPNTFTLSNIGPGNIYISKLDASGNFLWAKQISGNTNQVEKSITVDASGNVFVSGYFEGTSDFNVNATSYTLSSLGDQDIFVAKYDANGNFLWAKQMGGPGTDNANAVTSDATGNSYITGYFSGTSDFDPSANVFSLTSPGIAEDVFITKLNSTGDFVWAKQISSTGTDIGNSIALDGSGNICITGHFNNTADFDPSASVYTLTPVGGFADKDIFVVKLDNNGNLIWARNMGGTGSDQGNSITTDASGNIYTTGLFDGTANFAPYAGTYTLTSHGLTDAFISKHDASGNYIWGMPYGGTSTDQGNSITTDASGNVYTTGYYQIKSILPGIDTLFSAGMTDIFILKLDPSGNFSWSDSYGSTSNDEGMSITVDASNKVYSTGVFRGTINFQSTGTNTLTTSTNSSYILKVGQPIVTSLSEINHLNNSTNIYPNPSNGRFNIRLNEKSLITVTDVLGQQIYQNTLPIGEQTISIEDQTNGIYFIKVSESNNQQTFKIIKD